MQLGLMRLIKRRQNLIYSNRINATYLLANRPSFVIPYHTNPVTGHKPLDLDLPFPNLREERSRFRPKLHEGLDGSSGSAEGEALQRVSQGKEEKEDRPLRPMTQEGGSRRRNDHEEVNLHPSPSQRPEGLQGRFPTTREVGEPIEKKREGGAMKDRP